MAEKPLKNLIDELLADYEKTIARLILFCHIELPFPLGVKKTIDVLKGNKSNFVVNHSLNKLHTFSVMPGFTRDQVSDMLDILINSGLIMLEIIEVNGEQLHVLKISDKGIEYLKGKRAKEFAILDALMDKDVPEIPEDDQDLYYKLKLTRRQLAEEDNIPAFMVCSDKVLHGLCIKKPMENLDMERIKGVGPQFIEDYGKQFLYVIRQYVTREKNI